MGGGDRVSGNLQALAVGASNLIATFIAMSLIDRLGRKMLLLIGSVGMAVGLGAAASVFFTQQHQRLLLYLIVGYVGFFALSQGAVIWVYLTKSSPLVCGPKDRASAVRRPG
jgi:SP family arabinose:H+ symporter-like MFS transporter